MAELEGRDAGVPLEDGAEMAGGGEAGEGGDLLDGDRSRAEEAFDAIQSGLDDLVMHGVPVRVPEMPFKVPS